MGDKRLLELAAKAAGMVVDTRLGVFHDGSGRYWLRVKEVDERIYWHWNPFTDDGDALRLAVKLNLTIGEHLGARHAGIPPCADDYEDGRHPTRIAQMDGADPYAATRRAITRAAAAIGEQMP